MGKAASKQQKALVFKCSHLVKEFNINIYGGLAIVLYRDSQFSE